LGAKRVNEKEHEEIMEEIACRAALEHNKMLENEHDSDSASHSSSSDDSDSDDKSGTDNK
jgi:5-methylcytosine-specific restriction endonuclease McrBC regulatory subunit McrC